MKSVVATLLVLLASCGGASGPTAPEVQAGDTACNPSFCLTHPAGWVAEVGDTFITLGHSESPDVLASAGEVDMEFLAESGGVQWPASPDDVVRAFWALLGEGQSAEMESLEVQADGSVWSRGTLGEGRLWHALVPFDGSFAIGIEVRAPNTSWQPHADAIRSGLTATP